MDWCFVKCYGVELAKRLIFHNDCGAGCVFSAAAYRAAGRFDRSPRAGSQIFFGKPGSETHTGLVIEVKNGSIITIEGNSADSVRRKSYSVSNTAIAGFGHPMYELLEAELSITEPIDDKQEELIEKSETTEGAGPIPRGTVENTVRVLQALLIAGGNSCGAAGIDGEMGPDTINAYNSYLRREKSN